MTRGDVLGGNGFPSPDLPHDEGGVLSLTGTAFAG